MSSEADETIGGTVLGGRPGIWKECKAPWLRESEFKCSDHVEIIEEFKLLESSLLMDGVGDDPLPNLRVSLDWCVVSHCLCPLRNTKAKGARRI
jgi:hypothetical protein